MTPGIPNVQRGLTAEQLLELTRSSTAARLGIKNEPDATVLANLERLRPVLDQVEALCGAKLFIHSGYRSPELNAAVGGAKNSYHMIGCAADFDPPPGMTHDQLQHAIGGSGIVFDKCIEEKARDGAHWLHLQIARPGEPARRALIDADLDHLGGEITRTHAG